MSDLSPAHIGTGQVMTVAGPVSAADLGVTLMHEHLLNDCRCWWNKPKDPRRSRLACDPVHPGILGELRMDPFVNVSNCTLDDERLAMAELADVVALGGRTVVDPTCQGIGRDPRALLRISQATQLNVVMGGGYYLQASHPERVRGMSSGDIADEIVREAVEGVGGTGIRIGLIGEIGISADVTAEEEKSLRGAAQAQRRTGLPLMVHLPGWFRVAHRVLDLVADEGGEMRHTVLCHMNPSGADVAYQVALAERGAFLEYDMIGMDYYYAAYDEQSPSDEDNARAILDLIDKGFGHKVLMSQDVFLKIMLTKFGGFGYGYILKHFLPRLKRLGIDHATIDVMMKENPVRVFSAG